MEKTGRDHPNSRVIAHFTSEFMLRAAANIGAYFAHDYEVVILFLAVLTRTGQNVMSDPKLRERFASYAVPIPDEYSTPVSRLALSRSTGLPRETVRRKVARMIEQGFLIEDTRGGLRVPSVLTEDENLLATMEPQLPNLRRLLVLLNNMGALDSA